MYDCDALLPTADRYGSLKFRRVSRWFRPTKLDWEDALELVAFVETIGFAYARWIFHWHGQAVVKAYARLKNHVGAEADPLIRANHAELGPHVGVAVWKAMLDGGWPVSKYLPPLVRQSVRQLYFSGMKPNAIASLFGMPVTKVKSALRHKTGNSRAKAAASLGIG